MWISVKDKLPTYRKEVLITDGKYIDVGELWENDYGFVETQEFARCFNVTHWQPLPQLPQEQEIETEIDIKQGISEQSKKWEDGCNAYNQERINKLAEEIKAKQEELRDCDEIGNIASSGYKAL